MGEPPTPLHCDCPFHMALRCRPPHSEVAFARTLHHTPLPLSRSNFDVPGFVLHACARTDHSVSELIHVIFN